MGILIIQHFPAYRLSGSNFNYPFSSKFVISIQARILENRLSGNWHVSIPVLGLAGSILKQYYPHGICKIRIFTIIQQFQYFY
jgi:hypothetical protein